MKQSLNIFSIICVFSLIIFSGSCKKDDVPDQDRRMVDTVRVIDSSQLVLDSLGLNQLQYIGSHNSYRLKTYDPLYDWVQQLGGLLPSSLNPDEWDYTHLPLEEQFSDYGVRKIELDIYYDPNGGRFANRGR